MLVSIMMREMLTRDLSRSLLFLQDIIPAAMTHRVCDQIQIIHYKFLWQTMERL